MSQVRGQGHVYKCLSNISAEVRVKVVTEYECLNAIKAEAYISTVWRRGSLVYS